MGNASDNPPEETTVKSAIVALLSLAALPLALGIHAPAARTVTVTAHDYSLTLPEPATCLPASTGGGSAPRPPTPARFALRSAPCGSPRGSLRPARRREPGRRWSQGALEFWEHAVPELSGTGTPRS